MLSSAKKEHQKKITLTEMKKLEIRNKELKYIVKATDKGTVWKSILDSKLFSELTAMKVEDKIYHNQHGTATLQKINDIYKNAIRSKFYSWEDFRKDLISDNKLEQMLRLVKETFPVSYATLQGQCQQIKYSSNKIGNRKETMLLHAFLTLTQIQNNNNSMHWAMANTLSLHFSGIKNKRVLTTIPRWNTFINV